VSAFFEVSGAIFMPVSCFTVESTFVVDESTILLESELELELFPLHATADKAIAAARNGNLM